MVAADRTSAFKTLPLTFLHLELTDKGKCKRQAGFCILQCGSWLTRRNGEQTMTRTIHRYLYDVTFPVTFSFLELRSFWSALRPSQTVVLKKRTAALGTRIAWIHAVCK